MHIEKYKNASVGSILGHLERTHKHYKNENVDLSKSDKNIYFVKNDIDYYNKRMEQLYVYGGWKDKTKLKYNSIVDIVVHCPKNYKDKERFFKIMNYIFTKKYGKDNIICSVVHNDEESAHLHFCFIPTIYNEKRKQYQLSYEKCMAHKFNSFHEDIEKDIQYYFPKDNIKLHDEDNKNKFYFDNIEDYKQYKEQLDNIKNQYDDLENKYKKLKKVYDQMNLYYEKYQNGMLSFMDQEMYKDLKELNKEMDEVQFI